ncbi:MAG: hypothetical protein L6R39_001883 [Caloplaca ligustica]|nr:MAG: hypothetical protein L6R39_001883 [Caloplaca ligustica]
MKPLKLALTILPLVTNAYKGDLTYFTPGPPGAPGSCGIGWDGQEDVVALSKEIMHSQDFANPNINPRCNKYINIWNEETQQAHQARVIDTCMGCAPYDIDVNPGLFAKVAPNGDGRVHGIDWGVVGPDPGNLIGG